MSSNYIIANFRVIFQKNAGWAQANAILDITALFCEVYNEFSD